MNPSGSRTVPAPIRAWHTRCGARSTGASESFVKPLHEQMRGSDMQTDTFNHADRVTFFERLGRLAGSTTWREPGQGGGVPYVARRIPTEHAMALALAM